MPAYVVQVRRESLGSGAPSYKSVCAIADNEDGALKLVKTALRLDDEVLQVIRALSESEAHTLGLKPFQVKRMS